MAELGHAFSGMAAAREGTLGKARRVADLLGHTGKPPYSGTTSLSRVRPLPPMLEMREQRGWCQWRLWDTGEGWVWGDKAERSKESQGGVPGF